MFKASKRNQLLGTAIIALALSVTPASAASKKLKAKKGDLKLRIAKIHTEEVAIDPSLMTDLKYSNPAPQLKLFGFMEDITELEMAFDKVVNLGKKMWALVEENRPVVNVSLDSANALPFGVQNAFDLEGWRAPYARAYRKTYENFYGVTVIDYTYQVMFTYGGSMDGVGRYIANAQIIPSNLRVMWGYTFNAKAKVQVVTNAGSRANPVAAIQLAQVWSIDTAINHEENTNTFYMSGAGEFKDMNP
ncbi:hypothetical protein WDW86_16510 [Bdellovibrionota bacterium FG-2]